MGAAAAGPPGRAPGPAAGSSLQRTAGAALLAMGARLVYRAAAQTQQRKGTTPCCRAPIFDRLLLALPALGRRRTLKLRALVGLVIHHRRPAAAARVALQCAHCAWSAGGWGPVGCLRPQGSCSDQNAEVSKTFKSSRTMALLSLHHLFSAGKLGGGWGS